MILGDGMTECNAIIKANNEIDKLKRENKKLNALCVQYGFEVGRLEEENEQLKQFIQELAEQGCGKIILANGNIYKASAVLHDWIGDVE